MKKNLLFALLFSLFFAAIFAQTAAAQCPGQMDFYNQKLVDSFLVDYPGCKNLNGPVDIFGSTITNLNGLLGLESIGGDLRIHDTNLKNLHGLDSLETVGGVLVFQKNLEFESFEGLGNLRQIGTGLSVEGLTNPKLKNFHGLEGLERIEQFFDIYFGNIESFEGLKNLRFVGEGIGEGIQVLGTKIPDLTGLEKLDSVCQLAFQNMKRLKSMSGVKNLRYASLGITGCDSLKNLTGLEALESGSSIYIADNKMLESLDGLEHFGAFSGSQYPFGSLWLFENPLLHDLSALDHPLKINNLFLKNNPALAICNVQAICEHLAAPGDTTSIFGNLPGCDSAGEILAGCSVASDDFSERTGFEIFPNPISEGEPLQILLENDFLGEVKIEIFALDGRLLKTVFWEKTANNVVEVLNLDDVGGPFFVRVSDGERTAKRLVMKH